MYCCAGKLRFANGTELLRYSKKFQLQIQQIDFFENPFFFTNSSSTIVTKTAFNQTEGFPVGVKFNEDIQFFCSLALLVEVVYCPFPLSIYMKEVEGHASFDNSNDYAIIVQRTNVVFLNWQKSSKKNKTFLIFTRYEIRNELVQYLRNKEYKKLDYLLSRLDPALLKCFPSIELKFYQKKNLRLGNIFYIYLTKLRWKLRGYPVPKYKSV